MRLCERELSPIPQPRVWCLFKCAKETKTQCSVMETIKDTQIERKPLNFAWAQVTCSFRSKTYRATRDILKGDSDAARFTVAGSVDCTPKIRLVV